MTPMSPPEAEPVTEPPRRSGLASTLHDLRTGALADSFAMSLAAGGAAAVGMVSWIVAARALTPAELGVATAFVSGFLLIAGCTELNLGVGLLRWLPRAGGASRALLRRAGAAVALAATAASSVYLLLPDTSVIVDAVVGTEPGGLPRWVGGALFVLAAVLYALFQQQDFVLVGLGHGWWAPLRTLLFALLRLGVLLVAGASLTTSGVVASWIGPAAACVIVVWAWHRRVTARRSREPRELPPRRVVLTFLGPTYLGQVATSVLFNQVPLLVTFRYGPESGAAFFLVWQIVFVVDVIATYFVAALSAAVAREPERAAELSRHTRSRLLLLLIPALVVGALLAEPVLSLFGPAYVTDAPVLQIMFGGLVLRLLVVHRLGEHQATGRGVRFARLAMTNTVLVVGVTALIPTGPRGLIEIACGFVAVQVLCAAAVYRPGRVNGGPGRITPPTGGAIFTEKESAGATDREGTTS